jgi:hypothetical protein
MTSLLEEFANFTETLNRQSIDYAICGGWAMAIHGLPRATVDIDLLILTEDLDKVWKTAQNFGYDVEGLILLKTISGREQDLLDIKKLREIENES